MIRLITYSLGIVLLLFFSTISTAQERSTTRDVEKSTVTRTAISVSSTPGNPEAATDLSAGSTAATSAACCLKQCAGGGSCGQNCTVADSMSQCGAVNFKFECPADKGLSCLGSNCTCQ